MPDFLHALVALSLLVVALIMASEFGLLMLIANGYGMLTFGFIAVFVFLVLTRGLYKIMTKQEECYP